MESHGINTVSLLGLSNLLDVTKLKYYFFLLELEIIINQLKFAQLLK